MAMISSIISRASSASAATAEFIENFQEKKYKGKVSFPHILKFYMFLWFMIRNYI